MVRNQRLEFKTLIFNSMLLNKMANTSHSGKLPQTEQACRLATWMMTTVRAHLNGTYATTKGTGLFFIQLWKKTATVEVIIISGHQDSNTAMLISGKKPVSLPSLGNVKQTYKLKTSLQGFLTCTYCAVEHYFKNNLIILVKKK